MQSVDIKMLALSHFSMLQVDLLSAVFFLDVYIVG